MLLLLLVNFEKSQLKPHSFACFSAGCAAAIVHRNHFFVCTKRINLLFLKKSSDRLVIVTKGFLKLPNLIMLIKQKSSLLPKNVALRTSGELLIVFSTKLNLLYFLYSMAWRYCLLHLIKQHFLLKTFKNSNLDDSGISLSVFLSTTNLSCIIFLLLPRWLKRS